MVSPFVSVVVLNYNGLRFLDDCLGSLERLDYPRDRYEVVLVDNVSTDGSSEVAEKRFPGVRVIRNARNLGFAAGNNVAMRGNSADYVALLNNDTAVEPLWLAKLVEAAEGDPSVGACTSKLLFRHDRLKITLEADAFRPGDRGLPDGRELGVQLFDARATQGDESTEPEFLEGFFGPEPSPQGTFRWSAGSAKLGVPVDRAKQHSLMRLVLAAPRPDGKPVRLMMESMGRHVGEWELDGSLRTIEAPLPEELVRLAVPVIQNAGTLILKDGSGRDRGTVVRESRAFQEEDRGQYDRAEEVFGACGAALLFRRAMLEDVGLFDEDFFMYYEDMDLSWRARRRGWKVLYVPDAVVRHVHCGSSVEWSPLFLYNVERNRLLMLAKNAPLGMALREGLRYLSGVAANLLRCCRSLALRSSDRDLLGKRVRIQLRVLVSLVLQTPKTMAKRRELRRREAVPDSKLLQWMVEG